MATQVLFRLHDFRADMEAVCAANGAELLAPDGPDAVRAELPRVDTVWVSPMRYDRDFAADLQRYGQHVRWVALPSAGYDGVVRLGIPDGAVLTNVGGVLGPVVAEHALALLLALTRGIASSVRLQREGQWDVALGGRVRSLEDLTIAILGLGSIGRAFAARARPLARRLIAVTSSGRADPCVDAVFPRDRLHQALNESDAVVAAVPLTADTRHLLDASALAALPPAALVVNVARGPVVDTGALLAALDGHLGGAALDVTDPEPLPPEHPLWRHPKVVIVPHVGGFGSAAARVRLAALFERNLQHFQRGESLEAVVPI